MTDRPHGPSGKAFAADWGRAFVVAVAFLTRLPVRHRMPLLPGEFARAHLAFPVIGAALGASLGAAYWLLDACGTPRLTAATITLAVGGLATGGLHEDGLADTFDGLGGGSDRASKLLIMKDSRLGTYGALALVLVLLSKATAIASLAPAAATGALVTAHAMSRAAATCVAAFVGPARLDGLGAAESPGLGVSSGAVGGSLAIALCALTQKVAGAASVLTVIVAVAVGWVSLRQLGGRTGDVLGATQQLSETAILVACASLAGP